MSSLQPVTFYVPPTSLEPIEVGVAHSGLRLVLVSREAVSMLDDSWAVLGVYFLLGAAEDPDRFRAYVGEVGRRTLLVRLREHASQKEWWSRALLIASASDEFNSAEIGWLEGRLYDVLNNAVAAEVMNRGRPGDDSIAQRDRGVLERYVEPIMAALRAAGAPPDTADQKPEPRGRRTATRYRESVKDLIDAGLLKAGTRLRPLRRTLTETALVLDDGRLEVATDIFDSVSRAAIAVSGNKAEAGWDFWGAPSGDGGFVALDMLRQRLRQQRGSPTAKPARTEGTPSRPPRTPAEPSRQSSRRFSETVADLLAAELLRAGTQLHPARKGLTGTATVLDDGRLEVHGQSYASLSAAAKAVSGGKAEPGWNFWLAELNGRRVSLYELRERYRSS